MTWDHKLIRYLTAAFASGFLLSWFVFGSCDNTKYLYLNKDISCNGPEVVNKADYESFKDKLVLFIESQNKAMVTNEVSVYFRDLHAGPIFGINELKEYAPASLLKLPLALAYLSEEENHQGILGRRIKYVEQTSPVEQSYKPSVKLEFGSTYTIEELIYQLLVYSDNDAAETLRSHLKTMEDGENLLHRTYIELGIITPKDTLEETVDVKGYASIFRILYNASYLNEDLANKMLSWLSEIEFKDGLIGGVPEGIKVSHKFGERNLRSDDGMFIGNSKQLHDCGIIYYPDNPYILCIMTKGNDFKKLESVIQTISKMVYEEVDSRRF